MMLTGDAEQFNDNPQTSLHTDPYLTCLMTHQETRPHRFFIDDNRGGAARESVSSAKRHNVQSDLERPFPIDGSFSSSRFRAFAVALRKPPL
jgi:hypothetical protein